MYTKLLLGEPMLNLHISLISSDIVLPSMIGQLLLINFPLTGSWGSRIYNFINSIVFLPWFLFVLDLTLQFHLPALIRAAIFEAYFIFACEYVRGDIRFLHPGHLDSGTRGHLGSGGCLCSRQNAWKLQTASFSEHVTPNL